MYGETHRLRLPPRLYERLPPAVARYCLNVIRKTGKKTGQSKQPKDDTQWKGKTSFRGRSFMLEME